MNRQEIEERDEDIAMMAKANVYSLKELAEQFNVSESVIKKVCRKNDIPYDPNRKALLELAVTKKFTVPELAELLGYIPEHCRNILHKEDVDYKGKPWTSDYVRPPKKEKKKNLDYEKKLAEARQLRLLIASEAKHQEQTVRELAESFKVSTSTVNKALNEHGIEAWKRPKLTSDFPNAVSEQVKVSPAKKRIRQITKPKTTHAESRERSRKIIQAASERTVKELAEMFDVTEASVRNTLTKYKVKAKKPTKKYNPSSKSAQIIELLKSGTPAKVLAETYGVTRQQISAVKVHAIKHGYLPSEMKGYKKKKPRMKICVVCGKVFKSTNSALTKKQRTCSLQCGGKWRSEHKKPNKRNEEVLKVASQYTAPELAEMFDWKEESLRVFLSRNKVKAKQSDGRWKETRKQNELLLKDASKLTVPELAKKYKKPENSVRVLLAKNKTSAKPLRRSSRNQISNR